jgi:hypothetical protein
MHNEKLWTRLKLAKFTPFMSVYDYFETNLGVAPLDDTLADLPIDSPCGAPCQRVIDAAKRFLEVVRESGADPAESVLQVAAVAFEVVETLWRG